MAIEIVVILWIDESIPSYLHLGPTSQPLHPPFLIPTPIQIPE
jgi:hypothetical protein